MGAAGGRTAKVFGQRIFYMKKFFNSFRGEKIRGLGERREGEGESARKSVKETIIECKLCERGM